MIGGLGNDIYIVDTTTDTITEAVNEGTDTVQSSVSFTLGANLENLTLTGTAANGTGNALDNVITGNAAANTFTGGGGNDSIIGGGGTDTVVMSGLRANYTVTQISATVFQIVDNTAGRDGTDTLTNVTNVQFTDGTFTAVDSRLQLSSMAPAAMTRSLEPRPAKQSMEARKRYH